MCENIWSQLGSLTRIIWCMIFIHIPLDVHLRTLFLLCIYVHTRIPLQCVMCHNFSFRRFGKPVVKTAGETNTVHFKSNERFSSFCTVGYDCLWYVAKWAFRRPVYALYESIGCVSAVKIACWWRQIRFDVLRYTEVETKSATCIGKVSDPMEHPVDICRERW